MRIPIYIIAPLLLLYACSGDNKIVVEYPDSGMKEIYAINEDSLIHGEKLVYLDNGELLYSKSNYDNGLLSGDRLIYHPNGNIEIHEQYQDDVLHDTLKVYYPTGELQLVMNYDKGVLNGVVTKFYESGKIEEQVLFKNNEENGPFTEYYENGTIHWKGNYLNGENEFGLLEEFDIDGEPLKRMMCDSMAICKTIWTKENGDIVE